MGAEYKVLKIDELTRVSDTKGIEKYYRYQIRTKGKVVITVDIDEEDAVEEKAGPILLKRAQAIDKTLAL